MNLKRARFLSNLEYGITSQGMWVTRDGKWILKRLDNGHWIIDSYGEEVSMSDIFSAGLAHEFPTRRAALEALKSSEEANYHLQADK